MSIKYICVFTLWISISVASEAPRIELNDGNKIPVVALGTGRVTAPESAPIDEVRQAVYWAIEAGYRHIDTASIYGDEEQVGQGIAQAIADKLVTREDLFVTTKLWNDKHRFEQVVPALQESLKTMKLDYVDLFLIHFPFASKPDDSPDDVDYLETWRGMEKAKDLGLAKSIGISNFNASQIARLVENSKVVPAVHEFEINPTNTQEALVNYCRSLGITVMGYSPLGFVVSRGVTNAPPPRANDPTLVNIANKYHKSTVQVVLRYLVDRGIIPIPKSTNKKRIAQNIDLFDFNLTTNEIAQINAFNKNKRVIDTGDYKDYPNYPFME